MSDDDEVLYVKKPRTIHYGSLEDSEKARLAALEAAGDSSNDAEESSAPSQSNMHINISNGIRRSCIVISCIYSSCCRIYGT